MDHSRPVARVLEEVAAARRAIAASYVHLWRADQVAARGPDTGRHEVTEPDAECGAQPPWQARDPGS